MNGLRKFSSKFFFSGPLLLLILSSVTAPVAAQRIPGKDFDTLLTKKDTIKPRTIPPKTDSLLIISSDTIPVADTVPGADSVQVQKIDTFSLKLSKDTLDAPLQYFAEDSVVVMIKSKKILLYGKTKTEYQDLTLTAPRVSVDQEAQVLTAVNSRDSTGAVLEDVIFKQGENEFTSDTIAYNIKTQKGLTKNTITQSGEMFVHGELVKKIDENVTFVKRGFFTTCNLDDPHFGFRTSELKVITKKVAVSGPAHPEFEGVPVPVYIPFGFYPLSQGRKSGLLPPQFETNDEMGIGLTGLGYYKVFSQYWDTKLYGDIYSYGSWAVNLNPTYRKRYRYAGGLNFGLRRTKRNFKGDPDYYSNTGYTLTWHHSADTKARPGTTFSANVNMSSTTYNENVPNDPNLNFQNQLSSSIAYSKSWADKPYNLTVTANHNQNNQTRLVSLILPDVGFTVNTLYPFQKKDFIGSKKWYEQLGVAYSGNFRNQVSFYDTAVTVSNLIDTFQWGAQHSIPISLSLPPILGGAIVVSPGISYSQIWAQQRLLREWDSVNKKVDSTIEKGFFVDQQASFSLSFNTAVFGTYQFKNSKVVALRHVIRPSLSANYRPDLSQQYYTYKGQDSLQINDAGYKIKAPQLVGGIFNGYAPGKTGGLSFQLDNNLEMKVRNKKDTTGEEPTKKVRLIDGFGFSTAYNFLAENMKLSPFQFYFRTNLFDKININANASMSPYEVDSLGRDIDEYVWESGGFGLGRLTSGSISLSTSFQSKPKDAQKDKERKEQVENVLNDPVLAADRQRLMDYMRQNPAEFVDFNIPWQINFSYSLYFQEQFKPDYSGFEKTVRSSANFSGSFSLTPKWNFSVNGFYDFDTKTLQTFTMSINREMHCWQLAINITPVGVYRYFNFTISPKSGLLQDLRINRTRSFYTGY